ncbi:tail assembly chaperone [Loigolactobacillus backii]|uniref:tail assembly chaperone n=1 Tax=Loigolactobacillus backii TaxID=375175 RepID=UPI0022FD69DC|nr:tail assembly chaperone [Loigolactobacillus backii]MDA5386953.1 tail assembly chaperone [Loigolactobacillus backii]MDA5389491.1 tail assembly chaperone [Loigolactobacillus backii]
MELTINGKDYSFVFGFGFLRKMNELRGISRDGVNIGMGVQVTAPALKSFDVLALIDVLRAANATEKARVSVADLEEFISTTDKLEQVFDQVWQALTESNLTRLAVKKLKM